jgi:HD-GYP domain-containing protein (c-di-GMP phosphodiesterase class II)
MWQRQHGWPAAAEVLVRRRGRSCDPAVVDALLADGECWLTEVGDDPCAAVLDAEPDPVMMLSVDDLDSALGAVADFVDLKSPFLRGHSVDVAALAVGAAHAAGLSESDATMLGRAALLHDVGRVGIANGIWDHPGPLSADQWERVWLHTYLTERVLHRCTPLAPFADVAARHHERADGSGYHRGATGDQLDLRARLLAAADAFHAMVEHRPHRRALDPTEATSELLDAVDSGQFSRAEVDAVLSAAGQVGRPSNVARPAGLTEREVDVLRLIARGQSNKEVAASLGISPRTVGHHIEHIYAKAAVATRAGATLFAMEHGLLSP